jgi:ABC-type glycerol-3-phosphate transport system permease component
MSAIVNKWESGNRNALQRFAHTVRRIPLYLILIVLALVDLFPLFWIGVSSFKSQGEIFRYPPTFLPKASTIGNYQEALGLLPRGQQPLSEIPIGLRNSLVIAASATVAIMVFGSLAGYAFARIPFPGRGVIFFILLSEFFLQWCWWCRFF